MLTLLTLKVTMLIVEVLFVAKKEMDQHLKMKTKLDHGDITDVILHQKWFRACFSL